MQYESPTSCGLKVRTKLKVFVHADNSDARAYDISSPEFVLAR